MSQLDLELDECETHFIDASSALLDLFPDAKFVHISRSPYDVFPSTKKLHRSILDFTSLEEVHEADTLFRHPDW